ncbi:MAG: hypothetical protein QM493_11655 [Sulfurovum sp.]
MKNIYKLYAIAYQILSLPILMSGLFLIVLSFVGFFMIIVPNQSMMSLSR